MCHLISGQTEQTLKMAAIMWLLKTINYGKIHLPTQKTQKLLGYTCIPMDTNQKINLKIERLTLIFKILDYAWILKKTLN